MPLNLNTLSTPGVYIDEVSTLPPGVAAVETAVPAFIGYTERNPEGDNVPVLITSFLEYMQHFGGPPNPGDGTGGTIATGATIIDVFKASPDPSDSNLSIYDFAERRIEPTSEYVHPTNNMYFALNHYFTNGGGKCYIVSVGEANGSIVSSELIEGLDALKQEDEPTLLIIPEAHSLGLSSGYYDIYTAALNQCNELKDRFTIIDVPQAVERPTTSQANNDISNFQADSNLGDYGLYGGAYYPYLETTVDMEYSDDEKEDVIVRYEKQLEDGTAAPDADNRDGFDPNDATNLEGIDSDLLQKQIMNAVRNMSIVLPPSPALAGIYTRVDNERGVWKAPANVSVGGIVGPMVKITNEMQGVMNIDPNGGKSVNAIRHITGRGTLVWGARTLAGNDNEWRYISVRRFFNFVEESVKKATTRFVFEANDANTWVKVRAMTENFLTLQWSQGALQGDKPEKAFFVRVGLGQTMTEDDILNGRMIVEIGMAVVRPAEFIILRFMHKLPEA